jgi:hypothetical protein
VRGRGRPYRVLTPRAVDGIGAPSRTGATGARWCVVSRVDAQGRAHRPCAPSRTGHRAPSSRLPEQRLARSPDHHLIPSSPAESRRVRYQVQGGAAAGCGRRPGQQPERRPAHTLQRVASVRVGGARWPASGTRGAARARACAMRAPRDRHARRRSRARVRDARAPRQARAARARRRSIRACSRCARESLRWSLRWPVPDPGTDLTGPVGPPSLPADAPAGSVGSGRDRDPSLMATTRHARSAGRRCDRPIAPGRSRPESRSEWSAIGALGPIGARRSSPSPQWRSESRESGARLLPVCA